MGEAGQVGAGLGVAAAGGQAAAAGGGDPVAEGGVVTVLVYQVLAGHAVPPSPANIPAHTQG